MFDRTRQFLNQNYDTIKRKCKASNQLFVDNLFPANNTVLSRNRIYDNVVWKRPNQICNDPKLVVGRTHTSDVIQGQLGNCWFVAALSVLTCEKSLWNKVIPDCKAQEITSSNYSGIFKFKFWQFGEWVEVVIDDLLPTVNGSLLYSHSSTKNEFWSALLEKAYAKLNGGYENLEGGTLSESLQDFTGGICESISLNDYMNKSETHENKKKRLDELFYVMKKAIDRKSLMACAIAAKTDAEREKKLACGLIMGHAYAITKIQVLTIKENAFFKFLATTKEKLNMIRLNNPWGQKEWTGPWSDRSNEWTKVPKSERDKMGLTFDDDGEFWMEFSDFVRYFTEISICRKINPSMFSWSESVIYGKWALPDRAGGCLNNRSSFFSNPQYLFDIPNNDKLDETLINLDQKSNRCLGKVNLTIGFTILKVEDNRCYRVHHSHNRVATSPYINTRSIFMRLKLESGRYCIVPTTFEKNISGEFMLRIYTDSSSNLRELTLDYPKPFNLLCCNPCAKIPKCVTHINVTHGMKLRPDNPNSSFNSYVYIKCEGKTVQGRVAKNDINPQWKTAAIFYRHKPKKPIIIQVWVQNIIKDSYYGEIALECEPNNILQRIECYLFINNTRNNKTEKRPGKLFVEVQSMSDITAL